MIGNNLKLYDKQLLIVSQTTLNCFRLDQYDECSLTSNIGDLIWSSFLVHCTAQFNMPSIILKLASNYFTNSIDLENEQVINFEIKLLPIGKQRSKVIFGAYI